MKTIKTVAIAFAFIVAMMSPALVAEDVYIYSQDGSITYGESESTGPGESTVYIYGTTPGSPSTEAPTTQDIDVYTVITE